MGITLSCFAQESTRYFFKSFKEIGTTHALKAALMDEVPLSNWYWKLDASVSLLTYQYVGGEKGVEINWVSMGGIGVSYQKLSFVNGENWSDITLKALLELPTPTATTQKIGGCLGVFLWNNIVGLTVGYKIGYKYPFVGLAGSWNF